MIITKHYEWNVIHLVRILGGGFCWYAQTRLTSSTLRQQWDILNRFVMVIMVIVNITFWRNVVYLVRIMDGGFHVRTRLTSSILWQQWDILGRFVMVIMVMVNIKLCVAGIQALGGYTGAASAKWASAINTTIMIGLAFIGSDNCFRRIIRKQLLLFVTLNLIATLIFTRSTLKIDVLTKDGNSEI